MDTESTIETRRDDLNSLSDGKLRRYLNAATVTHVFYDSMRLRLAQCECAVDLISGQSSAIHLILELAAISCNVRDGLRPHIQGTERVQQEQSIWQNYRQESDRCVIKYLSPVAELSLSDLESKFNAELDCPQSQYAAIHNAQATYQREKGEYIPDWAELSQYGRTHLRLQMEALLEWRAFTTAVFGLPRLLRRILFKVFRYRAMPLMLGPTALGTEALSKWESRQDWQNVVKGWEEVYALYKASTNACRYVLRACYELGMAL